MAEEWLRRTLECWTVASVFARSWSDSARTDSADLTRHMMVALWHSSSSHTGPRISCGHAEYSSP